MSDLLSVVSIVVDGHETQDPANGYQVAAGGYGRGTSELERVTLESMDMEGRLLVQWTPKTMLGHVRYVVSGATATQLDARITTLIGWFRPTATDYTLTATLASAQAAGNLVESWLCEPADVDYGDSGILDEELLHNLVQEVTFSWPHAPTRL